MAATTAAVSRAGRRHSFLHHPQRVRWRGWLFQVHLWAGLLAAIYICLVGITGSVLVFQNELYSLARPNFFTPLSATPVDAAKQIPAYLEAAGRRFPQVRFTGVYLPRREQAIVQLEGEPRHPAEFNEYVLVYLDPGSAQILGMTDSHFWVAWLRELHVRLLGGRTGGVINGCGAGCLLLLSVTGVVIWWPGLKRWRRGMTVNLRRRMARINFDLHSAIGFWCLFFALVWGISGIYFTWPDRFIAALDIIMPAKAAAYPRLQVTPQASGEAAILPIIADAEAAVPGSQLVGLDLPEKSSDPLTVIVSTTRQLERSTYVFYDPFSGKRLRVWERGPGATLGTRIVYWLSPLHFGESWGRFFKFVWFCLGLSLPALAVTGVLMYWNRYLRKRVLGS